MIKVYCYRCELRIDRIGFEFIFNIILSFAVENLEWEFRDDDSEDDDGMRQWVDISNCGKTIKKKSGGYAMMRLNNEINIDLKYEINMCVKSELQNDALIVIGLVDSENWYERIYYHHDGTFCDNDQEIKRVNKKVNKGSIIKIETDIVKKTNDNKKIFKVTFTINDEDSCVMYYGDIKPNRPFLRLQDVDEVDVEVISKI